MTDMTYAAASTTRSPIVPPLACVVDDQLCTLDATLAMLPLHHFQADTEHLIGEVTPFFEQHPDCPGVIVTDQGQFKGMVSRQQILEWLINPRANLFEQPLSFLLRMTRDHPLILAGSTSLLEAAKVIFSQNKQYGIEPIVVSLDTTTYRLLDGADVLRAAWQMKAMDTRLRLERSHIQMIQTEKMASLGRLVNGVAHEILDPVGFIWGNLCHISDYTQDLLQLIGSYEADLQPLSAELETLRDDIELDYLTEDLPKAIASIQAGANRLKTLASSLQTFCYIDEVYPKPADIHRCLDSIVFLIETHLSGEIEVIRDYGALPPVTCYIGQLNQVFTNILSNAVQAHLKQMGETMSCSIKQQDTHESSHDAPKTGRSQKPCIRITTQVWTQHFDEEPLAATPDAASGSASKPEDMASTPTTNRPDPALVGMNAQMPISPLSPSVGPAGGGEHRWVSIRIADNGPGLSEAQYQQIYQAFAREQSTGKETSLAISHRIVTDKHDGKLLVRSPLAADALPAVKPTTMPPESTLESSLPDMSELPHGTEFQILLPIQ